MKQRQIKYNLLKTVFFLVIGIIFCAPFLLLLINAFKPYNDMVSNFLAWPKSLYLANFVNAVMQFVTENFLSQRGGVYIVKNF